MLQVKINKIIQLIKISLIWGHLKIIQVIKLKS